jgi:ketosteroid isomerase-like protein
MKETAFILLNFSLFLLAISASAQTNSSHQNKTSNNTMTTTLQPTQPVKDFFTAFGKGDFQGILNTINDHCTIIAVRAGERSGKQLYGTYQGKEGVKEFLSNLSATFDTKAFSVEHIVGDSNIVFANGKFTHQLKTTGKLFSSDWTLMCVVKEGKILEYHFLEDSAMFVQASAQ